MNKPTEFSYYLAKYLQTYLPGIQGASTNTVHSYRDTFTLFLNFCKEKKQIRPDKLDFPHINKALIEEFVLYLEQELGSKTSTRNQRLAAIHAFFHFLMTENAQYIYLAQEILTVPIKKVPVLVPSYLTLQGIEALLKEPDVNTIAGRRDLMILSLMYDTGARVQEIADLTPADIRLPNPPIIKLKGKGNKERIVPLMPNTTKMLKFYLDEHGFRGSESLCYPLFYNKYNSKLTRAGIAFIIKKYASSAHEKYPDIVPEKVNPHMFRHSRAMHLLQADVNLVYIRDLLGHASVKTTEIYARADNDMKRAAIEKASKTFDTSEMKSWQSNADLLSWLKSL